MSMQLEHVLASVGMRGGEIERDAFVDDLAACVAKSRERGGPWRRSAADDLLGDPRDRRTRDAHDANAAAPSRRCYPRDRVARRLTAWHGQACRDRTSDGSAIAAGLKECCSPANKPPGRRGRRRKKR